MKKLLSVLLVLVFVITSVPILPVSAEGDINCMSASDIKNNCLALASYEISNSITYNNPFDGWFTISTQSCNWAHGDYASYYIDDEGNLVVVCPEMNAYAKAENGGKPTEWGIHFDHKLHRYTYNNSLQCISHKVYPLPEGYDIWGGFYAAPDGNFYVAVGRENNEEDDNKNVIWIIKYSHDWSDQKYCGMKGNETNVFPGIVYPFECGRASFLMYGKTLIMHASRKKYADNTNALHETDITFFIDTETMQKIDGCDMPFISHSFNQFVLNDGKTLYFVDHGDAYPRGIVVSKFFIEESGGKVKNCIEDIQNVVMPFTGEEGLNYTGTCVGGVAQNERYLFIAGTSSDYVPDGFFAGTRPYRQNIFLIRVDKTDFSYTTQWITNYPFEGQTTAGSPRLMKLHDDCYALIYDVRVTNEKDDTYIVTFDADGVIKDSKKYAGVFFADNSDPIYYNDSILWVSPKNRELNNAENYFYTTKYTIPSPVVRDISIETTGEIAVRKGDSLLIPRNVFPSSAGNTGIEWTSDNTDIVSVDQTGRISGHAVGKAVISAKIQDIEVKCTVKNFDKSTEIHTLSYLLNDELYYTQVYAVGEKIDIIESPEAPQGYDFIGWKDMVNTMPSKEVEVKGFFIKFMLGDCNNDGTINTSDAVQILKYSAGMITLTDLQMKKGDMNSDKKVNTSDAVQILKRAAGMIEEEINKKQLTDIKHNSLALGSYEMPGTITYIPGESTEKYGIVTQDKSSAHSDFEYYYKDGNNLVVVIAGMNTFATFSGAEPKEWGSRYEKKIHIYTYDDSFRLVSHDTVSTPDDYNLWGGLYIAPDGNFYVAVGRENLEENDNKTVIKIIRYSHKWERVSECDIKGGETNVHKGITTPFAFGHASFAMQGSTLIMHTSRKMYKDSGAYYSSSITFYINTQTMQKKQGNMPYVSTSLNQFVLTDGNDTYFIDQCDSYPERGLIISKYTGGNEVMTRCIMEFSGKTGVNYTGACIGGVSQNSKYIFIVGAYANDTSGAFDGSIKHRQNIFVIRIKKSEMTYTKTWLTDYPANGKTTAKSPRLVKLSNSCFAILYNVCVNDVSDETYCVSLNGKGEVTSTKKYSGSYFADSSAPIYYGGKLLWISPLVRELHTEENYLYRLSYDIPG